MLGKNSKYKLIYILKRLNLMEKKGMATQSTA